MCSRACVWWRAWCAGFCCRLLITENMDSAAVQGAPQRLKCILCPFSTSHVGALKRHLNTWHISKLTNVGNVSHQRLNYNSCSAFQNPVQSMSLPVTLSASSTAVSYISDLPRFSSNAGMGDTVRSFESKENNFSSKEKQPVDYVKRKIASLLPEIKANAAGDRCLYSNQTDNENSVMVVSRDDSTNVLYLCRFCNKSFRSQLGLHLHVDSAHFGKFQYKCKLCGEGFSNLVHYRNHMSIHNSCPLKCARCRAVFQSNVELAEHSRMCLTELSAPAVQGQMKVEPRVRLYNCLMCGRQFKWRSSLKYHRDKGCVIKRFT